MPCAQNANALIDNRVPTPVSKQLSPTSVTNAYFFSSCGQSWRSRSFCPIADTGFLFGLWSVWEQPRVYTLERLKLVYLGKGSIEVKSVSLLPSLEPSQGPVVRVNFEVKRVIEV